MTATGSTAASNGTLKPLHSAGYHLSPGVIKLPLRISDLGDSVADEIETAVCKTCGETKALGEANWFYRKSGKFTGYRNKQCRDCLNRKQRKKRTGTEEANPNYDQNRTHHSCFSCATTLPFTNEFFRVEESPYGGKRFRVSEGGGKYTACRGCRLALSQVQRAGHKPFPGDMSKMAHIYRESLRLGPDYEVHHIIGLNYSGNENVSGLHVSHNLRILTKDEHIDEHRRLKRDGILETDYLAFPPPNKE